MKQEINPKDTNRAIAFELWMKSPMPSSIMPRWTVVMPRISSKNCKRQSILYRDILHGDLVDSGKLL